MFERAGFSMGKVLPLSALNLFEQHAGTSERGSRQGTNAVWDVAALKSLAFDWLRSFTVCNQRRRIKNVLIYYKAYFWTVNGARLLVINLNANFGSIPAV